MTELKTVSAIEVAKLLLSYDPEREYFVDGKMDSFSDNGTTPPTRGNFRLNKMLHICQMLHYAKYGEPLFHEDLRAYERGAIVYPIYKDFFSFYRQLTKSEEVQIDKEKKTFINKNYLQLSEKKDFFWKNGGLYWTTRFKGNLFPKFGVSKRKCSSDISFYRTSRNWKNSVC